MIRNGLGSITRDDRDGPYQETASVDLLGDLETSDRSLGAPEFFSFSYSWLSVEETVMKRNSHIITSHMLLVSSRSTEFGQLKFSLF